MKSKTPGRPGWSDNPKSETLVVRVEPDLKSALEKQAAKAGRPMASYARDLLREAVELRKTGRSKSS